MPMHTNFYNFVYDEKAKIQKTYKDLTEDDVIYIEAAIRKDYETTSALLDKYFQKKMPNTHCKRKAWRRDNKHDIWVYKTNPIKKSDAGWLGSGVYFYGAEEEAWKAVGYGYWMEGFYLNVENPFIMDRDMHNALVFANDVKVSERFTKLMGEREIDGIFWGGDMREEWCVYGANQIKRASITRDDDGNIIPISRRFDLTKKDNRF